MARRRSKKDDDSDETDGSRRFSRRLNERHLVKEPKGRWRNDHMASWSSLAFWAFVTVLFAPSMDGVYAQQDGQQAKAATTVQEAVVSVQDAVVEVMQHESEDVMQEQQKAKERVPLYGNLTSALYRFDASKLGPKYAQAIRLFEEYIGGTVDLAGAQFAAEATQRPGPRKYHQECYESPLGVQADLLELERAKKMHVKGGTERMQFLREEQDLFYAALDGHNETMVTRDAKWAWRTAAVYSAQYAGRQTEFRDRVNAVLATPGEFGFFGGVVSGTFWYPPRAVREWHSNRWDLAIDPRTGRPWMPWRMYFVRQKAATVDGGLDATRTPDSHPAFFADKSAMHLVDGNGVSADRLRRYGAYPLPTGDHDPNGPRVWRIPDQDGYVSLFRLQDEEPFRWHCIVADDTVHRYSMGMSLSDEGVEAMLRSAGVEL